MRSARQLWLDAYVSAARGGYYVRIEAGPLETTRAIAEKALPRLRE